MTRYSAAILRRDALRDHPELRDAIARDHDGLRAACRYALAHWSAARAREERDADEMGEEWRGQVRALHAQNPLPPDPDRDGSRLAGLGYPAVSAVHDDYRTPLGWSVVMRVPWWCPADPPSRPPVLDDPRVYGFRVSHVQHEARLAYERALRGWTRKHAVPCRVRYTPWRITSAVYGKPETDPDREPFVFEIPHWDFDPRPKE